MPGPKNFKNWLLVDPFYTDIPLSFSPPFKPPPCHPFKYKPKFFKNPKMDPFFLKIFKKKPPFPGPMVSKISKKNSRVQLPKTKFFLGKGPVFLGTPKKICSFHAREKEKRVFLIFLQKIFSGFPKGVFPGPKPP